MKNTAEIMHRELLELISTLSDAGTISDRSSVCAQLGSTTLTRIETQTNLGVNKLKNR
jgi:Trp operon repressor